MLIKFGCLALGKESKTNKIKAEKKNEKLKNEMKTNENSAQNI
jgi:hypothetical protein